MVNILNSACPLYGTCVAPIQHPQEPTDRQHAVYRPTDTVTIGPGEREHGDDRAALGAPDVSRPGLRMRTVGGESLGNDRRTGAQTQLSRRGLPGAGERGAVRAVPPRVAAVGRHV